MSNDSTAIPSAMIHFITEHRRRYRDSGGTSGHIVDTSVVGTPRFSPTLVLRTIGRKSGRPYATPLTYGLLGAEWVVIASKGGAPDHPAWYHNLRSMACCEMQVATQRFRCAWREAQDTERLRAWDYMCGLYPPYIDYDERATGRVIPVILLRPIEELPPPGHIAS